MAYGAVEFGAPEMQARQTPQKTAWDHRRPHGPGCQLDDPRRRLQWLEA